MRPVAVFSYEISLLGSRGNTLRLIRQCINAILIRWCINDSPYIIMLILTSFYTNFKERGTISLASYIRFAGS